MIVMAFLGEINILTFEFIDWVKQITIPRWISSNLLEAWIE